MKQAGKGKPSLWQIELSESVLYPESGGQPSDTGYLEATAQESSPEGPSPSPSGRVPVLEVQKGEGGEVWHLTSQPIPAGSQVEVTVDWERRYDLMQQHTGIARPTCAPSPYALLAAAFWART